MLFKRFKGGYDRNFCYVIYDKRQAVVIDPFKSEELYKFCDVNLNVRYIINTHSHHDHIEGNVPLKERTGAEIIIHKSSDYQADKKVEDGEELIVGDFKVKFVHTPGHSKDGMCILIENMLFTGDLLFVGKVGGTGSLFKGSDPKLEFDSLHKIMKLDKNIKIYPGHDYGYRSESTIETERKTNPFLLAKDFEEFMYIKNNWKEYKKEHNLV